MLQEYTKAKLQSFLKLNLSVAIFVFVISIIQISAFAEVGSGQCQSIFSVASFVSEFRPTTDLQLPADLLEWLKDSTQVAELRHKYRKVKSVGIATEPRGPFLILNDVESKKIDKGYKGENIQGIFLAKILKEIFPWIRIDGVWRPDLFFTIWDSSERYPRGLGPVFQINRIKPANPNSRNLNGSDVRSFLGVESADKIVNVYFDVQGFRERMQRAKELQFPVGSYPNLKQMVDQIKQSVRPKIIIVTVSGYRDVPPEWVDAFVSNVSHGQFSEQSDKTAVLYNDTIGFMPYLIGASDLHVVRGPVNIFEGLNQGVPTLEFNNRNTLGHYKPDGYNANLEVASHNSGFRHIENMSEFDSAAADLLQHGKTSAVYSQDNFQPVRNLLDAIDETFGQTLPK